MVSKAAPTIGVIINSDACFVCRVSSVGKTCWSGKWWQRQQCRAP